MLVWFVVVLMRVSGAGAASPRLEITEFMATNQNTVQDADGDSSPWIEIYNPTAGDVNLNGWALTDDPNNLMQWRFPNVTIPDAADANGSDNFMVVFASGKNRANNTNELHTNFRLPVAGGFLALVDPNTNIVSVFNSYPAQSADISYGRDVINLNLTGYFPTPTAGEANSIGGTNFSPGSRILQDRRHFCHFIQFATFHHQCQFGDLLHAGRKSANGRFNGLHRPDSGLRFSSSARAVV